MTLIEHARRPDVMAKHALTLCLGKIDHCANIPFQYFQYFGLIFIRRQFGKGFHVEYNCRGTWTLTYSTSENNVSQSA